jgi:hypothetical protein
MKYVISENQIEKIKSKIHEYVKKFGINQTRKIFGDKTLHIIENSNLNPVNESLLNQDGSLGDLSQSEINEILKGYIECALWTEEERLSDEMTNDEDDEDIDDMDEIEKLIYLQQNFSRKSLDSFFEEDIDGDSRIDAYLDIKKFIKLAGDDAIAEAIDDNGAFQLGMDIWLTRNGHGSGFFDHNYIHEDSLTTTAQQLKSKDLVIGDDGKLYFE